MRTRLVALAGMLAFAAAAQTFRVSGRVVDSENGMPLNRTRVVLSGEPVGELSLVTTADGRYSFDVPQGRYALWAARRDWKDTYGQPMPGNESGSAVVTGPARDTTQLVFRFRGPAAIRGKILDESGEPVPSAKVELFQQAVVGGRKRLSSMGHVESNGLGDYRWSPLAAGIYYLLASGEPWYFSDELTKEELTEAGIPPVSYAPVYFPGTADPSRAHPVVLRPGTELRADFILRPAAGVELRPVCASSNDCNGTLILSVIGPGRAEAPIHTAHVNPFEIPVITAVPPGRYLLHYNSPKGTARKPVDVQGRDITIEFAPKPAPKLTGRIIFQNSTERPPHTLYANLEDDDTGQIRAVAVDAAGGFSWPTVTASHARVFLSGSDGFFVAQMSVDGAGVKDGVINLVDGATVRVSLLASSEPGSLNGFVKDEDNPAPGVLVILAPSDASSDPHRYLALQTATDASFEFRNVPAADYILFAVPDLEFEYATADAVLPYMAKGKRVRIQPHVASTEDIPLALATRN